MADNRRAAPLDSSPWPRFDDEMIDAAAEVLRSGRVNYWTGEHGRRFEAEFAEFCGCRHAIAVANGTLALELGLHALGIGPGDEVIVPSRTFIASASAVVARGARPVCADVDPDSGVLTNETVAAQITPRTKAVIAVHLAGWPCDMDALGELCGPLAIALVEDCAQAHGAECRGRPVGSLGDVAAFSFCQDKILTTGGEGGMLTTNRSDLWDRAWRYKEHGKTPNAFYHPQPPASGFRWLHESFGSNYRMSEMQSAIGRILLKRLPAWSETRRANARRLAAACRATGLLRAPEPPPDVRHACYKFYAYVRPQRLGVGWDRDRLVAAVRQHGVPCFSGSCSEIYLEDAFPHAWRPAERLPVAKALGETSLMLLVDPTIGETEITRACEAISQVTQAAKAGRRRIAS